MAMNKAFFAAASDKKRFQPRSPSSAPTNAPVQASPKPLSLKPLGHDITKGPLVKPPAKTSSNPSSEGISGPQFMGGKSGGSASAPSRYVARDWKK